MLAFDFPWAFLTLPLPLLFWWLLPAYREATSAVRTPFFEQLTQATGLEAAPGAVILRTNWAQKLLAPICWALTVTAMASPQWIEPPLERIHSARDLLLAIDISQSMETRDFVDPAGRRVDRLTAVKQVVNDFIDRRKGDRIGLIVFGTGACRQAPPTLDHERVKVLLDEVRIGMAGPQTAIGDAIGVAIKMTEHSQVQEKVVILLTDGNDTASRVPPDQAAEMAKGAGITIHSIGIGDPHATGESKVELDALKKLAGETGGRSFRGENRQGLQEIYATLDRITPQKVTRIVHRPQRALYMYPLGAAVVLLLLYHVMMLLITRMASTKSAARNSKDEIRGPNLETTT